MPVTERQRAFLQSYALENLSKPDLVPEPEGVLDKALDLGKKAVDAGLYALDTGAREVTRPVAGVVFKAQASLPDPIADFLLGEPGEHTIHEEVRAAKSFTDAYEAKMKHANGLERFLFEAVGDPSNYIGAGIFKNIAKGVLKAAQGADDAARWAVKLYEANPNSLKIFNELAALDEFAGRVQALPITAAGKALKPVGKLVDDAFKAGPGKGKGLLDLSTEGEFRTGNRDFASLFDTYGADSLVRTALNPADSERLDFDARALYDRLSTMHPSVRKRELSQTDSYNLARVYRNLQPILKNPQLRTPQQDLVLKEIRREFGSRPGLLDGKGNLTPKFSAHAQLEETLVRAGMNSLQERLTAHGLLDIIAKALPQSSRNTYRNQKVLKTVGMVPPGTKLKKRPGKKVVKAAVTPATQRVVAKLFRNADDVYNRINIQALVEKDQSFITDDSLRQLSLNDRQRIIAQGQKLNEVVDGIARSATTTSLTGSKETVHLTRLSDASSVVHELLGHVFTRNLSSDQQAKLVKSLGMTQFKGTTQEALARGVERLIRTADPDDVRIKELFRDIQTLSQEAPLPTSQLDARGSEAFLKALVGEPVSPYADKLDDPVNLRRAQALLAKHGPKAGITDLKVAELIGRLPASRASDPRWAKLPAELQQLLTPSPNWVPPSGPITPPATFAPGFEPPSVGRATADAAAGKDGVFLQGRAPDDLTVPRDLPTARTPTSQLSDLGVEASVESSLRRVATESGLEPHLMAPVARFLTPLAEQNAQYFNNIELYQIPEVADLLVEAALNPAKSRELTAQAMDRLGATMSSFGIRHPYLSKVVKGIDRGVPVGQMTPSKAAGRPVRPDGVMRDTDRAKLMKAAEHQEVLEVFAEYAQEVGQLELLFNQVRRAHPTWSTSPTVTWKQVTEAANNGWFGEDLDDVLAFLHKWDLPEPKKIGGRLEGRHVDARSEKLRLRTMEAYQKARAKELGLLAGGRPLVWNPATKQMERLAKNKVHQGFDWMTKAWREQALLSGANFVANVSDMLVRSLIHGVNPLISEGNAFTFAKDIGLDAVPQSLRAVIHEALVGDGRGTSALGKIPVLGRALDPIVQFNWSLLNWQDSTSRMATWKKGTLDYLTDEVKPQLLTQAQRLGKNQGMDPAGIKRLVDDLKKSGVNFNHSQVASLVRLNGGSDVLANELAAIWQRGVFEASAHGESLAKQIQLDFLDEREIERILHLRTWLPFHTWATRNIPFYLQTAVHNPWLLRVWANYHEIAQDEADAMGLTKTYRDKLKAPTPFQGLLQVFLGPGTHYFNPLVIMSVTSQFKDPYLAEDAPASARLLNLLGRVGFRPAPWVDLPLNVLGAYGDMEPFGIWRQGDAFAGLTGIDEKPTVRLVNALSNIFPWNDRGEPLSGSTFKDYLINKQIRLLALSETGDADSPEYVAAMALPDSEIYQRAEEMVRQEQARRGIYSLLSPIPHARLDDQERDIRQTAPREELSDAARATLRDIEHPITGLWNIPDDRRNAEINAGFALTEGLPKDSPAQGPILQAFPEFADYLTWLKSRPKGADRSVKTYLARDR